MTLLELSAEYQASADLLRNRLRALQRRISLLTELLRQTNELTELTKRYYERGYWRNEKYTL